MITTSFVDKNFNEKVEEVKIDYFMDGFFEKLDIKNRIDSDNYQTKFIIFSFEILKSDMRPCMF